MASLEEAKIIFIQLALATLAELEQVALQNLLVSRLEGRVVHADGRPNESARRVGSILPLLSERASARAREELLAVALVREMRGFQNLPGTEHCLPTATAVFESIG